jgi:hypothetical protein
MLDGREVDVLTACQIQYLRCHGSATSQLIQASVTDRQQAKLELRVPLQLVFTNQANRSCATGPSAGRMHPLLSVVMAVTTRAFGEHTGVRPTDAWQDVLLAWAGAGLSPYWRAPHPAFLVQQLGPAHLDDPRTFQSWLGPA